MSQPSVTREGRAPESWPRSRRPVMENLMRRMLMLRYQRERQTLLRCLQSPDAVWSMGMQGMPPVPFSGPGFGNDAMGFMNPMFANGMGPGWNPMNMPLIPSGRDVWRWLHAEWISQHVQWRRVDADVSDGAGTRCDGPNPGFQGPGVNNFSNNNGRPLGGPYSREDDSPYFRQPVNPQRHQARHRECGPVTIASCE